jgi:hypothetical protein
MRRLIVTLAVVVLAFGVSVLRSPGDQPRRAESGKDEDKKVADLMRRKLTSSQKVLEGLAIADFDLIARNADELIRVSKAAEWHVVKTPKYEVFSNEFRRSAETLGQRARDKNLDGAALAYVELTLTCVRCHKHVREIRMARRE